MPTLRPVVTHRRTSVVRGLLLGLLAILGPVAISPSAASADPTTSVSGNTYLYATPDEESSSTLTLTNAGTSEFQISDLYMQDGLKFSVTDIDCVGVVLQPNQSCQFQVSFHASDFCGWADSVVANFETYGGPIFVVSVDGCVQYQAATVVPTQLDFGAVPVGDTSTPRTVTITSSGPGHLRIGQIDVDTSPPFDIVTSTNTCTGAVLADGESCQFDVVFSPTAAGAMTGTVYITTNTENGYETIPVSGNGGPSGFPRPRGASPIRVPLVPAFVRCQDPDVSHGSPLAFSSCRPPEQISNYLTIGTPDTNGQSAQSIGFELLRVKVGDSSTPVNEADVKLVFRMTDVRNKQDLSDYAGELRVVDDLRISDRNNGGASVAATMSDYSLPITVACTPTGNSSTGSTCALATTVNSMIPSAVQESQRATWEVGQVQVFDGGEDGAASTNDNMLFAKEGLFIP